MRWTTISLLGVLSALISPVVTGSRPPIQQVGFAVPQETNGRSLGVPPAKVKAIERDAFSIFNEVNSLLRQWGNTLSPNGFSYALGTIPKHTKLFHARNDAHAPKSPFEWLAFDPEMSFGIMGTRAPSWLRTYRATKDLGPVIYFNGFSAGQMSWGPLDAQDILMYGQANSSFWSIWNDYGRAKLLCEWAKDKGVAGFVRMNAGFEMIWCDWSVGLELVSNVDVSRWAKEMGNSDWGLPSDLEEADEEWEGTARFGTGFPPVLREHLAKDANSDDDNDIPSPRPVPPHHRPPNRGPHRDPFANYAAFEWFRSAVTVYGGERRVALDYGSFVTGYGRTSLPDGAQRLGNLTEEGIDDLTTDLLGLPSSGSSGSGVNWQDVTDQIVNRYGRRLPELLGYLSAPNSTTKAHRVLGTLLIPHYTFGASKEINFQACKKAFTVGFDSSPLLNKHEVKQLLAIEHVHGSICQVLLDLNDDIHLPTAALSELMRQLDWKMWTRCHEVCGYASVCAIDIWPLAGFAFGWERGANQTSTPECRTSEYWTNAKDVPGPGGPNGDKWPPPGRDGPGRP